MKLKDEMARLRDGLIFHDSQLDPPDARTAELLAQGDRKNAIRHCKEMYNEAVRRNDMAHADRYLAFVDQLQIDEEPDLTKIGL